MNLGNSSAKSPHPDSSPRAAIRLPRLQLALQAFTRPRRPTFMKSATSQSEPAFGFLSVLEHPTIGALGGLLLVNRRGRPLEFHCTAPVQTTRAEEILYGTTLRPHLYCERIGQALLDKATVPPAVVLVSQLDCWSLNELTCAPVVLVDPSGTSTEPSTCQLATGIEAACLDQVDPAQRSAVAELLNQLTAQVDLSEPFDRIAEAIREAGLLSSGETTQPIEEASHDQAA